MKIRVRTLWRVPVYCLIASSVSAFLTLRFGGLIYVKELVEANGVTQSVIDPVKNIIFNAVMFLLVLLVGGLLCFRSMTKKEIAVSTAITSALYLAIVLLQLFLPNAANTMPASLLAAMMYIQNWTSILSSWIVQLTKQFTVAVIAASFAPMLFVPFGRKNAA